MESTARSIAFFSNNACSQVILMTYDSSIDYFVSNNLKKKKYIKCLETTCKIIDSIISKPTAHQGEN
jgi:hypothetical protein